MIKDGEINYTGAAAAAVGQSFPGKVKSLLMGTAAGAVTAVLLITGGAALMTLSAIPDGAEAVFVYIAVALAGFAAGFVALLTMGSDGLVNGLIAGVCLLLLHLAVGSLIGEPELVTTLIYGAVELPCAALGGVISVNSKRKHT